MTESTSPLDDKQTFDVPLGTDPVTGEPVYKVTHDPVTGNPIFNADQLPVETVSIGTIEMVPLQDGTGAWLHYEIPGSCDVNLVIPEEAIKNFIRGRRAMVAKRIAPRRIAGFDDGLPDLKTYRR